MTQIDAGTLTVLQGEAAAAELALDMRLFNDKLPLDPDGLRAAVFDPATIAAIVSAIAAAGMLTAQIATLPGTPTPPPPAEVQDELTVLIRNSSGLTLVPVRNTSDRGVLSVSETAGALRMSEATRLLARTTGQSGSNLRLTLLIDDELQSASIVLTLDRTPGDGADRGWRFSEAKASNGASVSLPRVGNQELVALLFKSSPGDLEYALYLRGCQATSGTVSATLFDRTVRDAQPSADDLEVEARSTAGQLVRIASSVLGSSGRKRYLYDQDSGGRGRVLAKSLASPGQDASLWRILPSAGGYIALQNVETGRYLFRDSRGLLVTDPTALGVRRLWRVDTNSDAAMPFALRTSDLPAAALNVAAGDDRVVGLSRLNRESKWTIEDLSAEQSEELPAFLVQSKARSRDGTALVMRDFDEDSVRVREPDGRDERQRWAVRFQKNGQVLIQNVATLRFLATFNDGVLTTAGEGAGSSRLWRLRTNNEGLTFAIQSLAGGNANLVDTIVGDPSGERDKVNVAFNSTSDRQQWSFQAPPSE